MFELSHTIVCMLQQSGVASHGIVTVLVLNEIRNMELNLKLSTSSKGKYSRHLNMFVITVTVGIKIFFPFILK